MGKGGKYLAKKPVAAKKKKKGVLGKILIALLLVLLLIVGAGVLLVNRWLNQLSRPEAPVTAPTQTVVQMEDTMPLQTEETEPPTTSPEDTWPEVVSDENITNIMLVGQASREGEAHLISDTMILASINRETKTVTLTSLMRDMRLVWPPYVDTLGKTHSGNNRINMAYNMGYHWTGNKQDSMDVLESIVQHNFGIPVERTIEVDFTFFMNAVDEMGGAVVDINDEEYEYMLKNSNWMEQCGVHTGENRLCGYHALVYARMRKVGHGDYERTERQREVITSLVNNLKQKNILELLKLFERDILPYITTDLTNKEITNYAWEFIPMLKDLKIQGQRIPFDGNEMTVTNTNPDGSIDYMIAPRDLKATARQLQESIGMEIPVE